MKKIILTTALLFASLLNTASAAVVVEVFAAARYIHTNNTSFEKNDGLDVTYKPSGNTGFLAGIETGVPFLPNYMFEKQNDNFKMDELKQEQSGAVIPLSDDDKKINSTITSHTLYYAIPTPPLMDAYAGLRATKLVRASRNDTNTYGIYLGASLNAIPLVKPKISTVISASKTKLNQLQIVLEVSVFPFVNIDFGYQVNSLKTPTLDSDDVNFEDSDSTLTRKSVFIGISTDKIGF